jgi:DNA-binding SARP family transcriptional activator
MAQPDGALVIPLVAIWLSLVLVVPKRDWRSIPRRLRETSAGHRAYVFGPPVHQGDLQPDYLERWFQLLRRDWLRLLEMGLPLYALAAAAEIRGLAARHTAEAEAALSPAGLLSQHLQGRFPESELNDRLADMGLPVPASKLAWAPPRRYAAPPIEWAIEWQQHLRDLQAGRDGQGGSVHLVPPELEPERQGSPLPPLVIQTLGAIHIREGDEDLAGDLLHRPRQRFALIYLLAREVRRPGDRMLKPDYAEELFPGLDPSFQRASLRKRMSETLSRLPRSLARRVVAGEQVGLDLSGCQLDVRWVLDMAEMVRRSGEMGGAQVDDVERAVQMAREEFLPGWEEIEHRATGSRGAAADVIREVRDMVAAAHVSLTVALADHLLARRQAARAIPHLEDCLRRRPEREEVAARLVRAYEETGQERAAERLRDTGGLGEVE